MRFDMLQDGRFKFSAPAAYHRHVSLTVHKM